MSHTIADEDLSNAFMKPDIYIYIYIYINNTLENQSSDKEVPTMKTFLGYNCLRIFYTSEIYQKLAMLLVTGGNAAHILRSTLLQK